MEYISAQQAAQRWHVEIRQVQNLCRAGKVPGAVRFSRVWAIPAAAEKPLDGRRRPAPRPDKIPFSADDARLILHIINKFPHSISILTPDGVMVYANDAFMAGVLEDVRENTIGQYNVNDEPHLEEWGIKEHMEKALRGEAVFTPNLKLPNRELVGTRYRSDYAFVSIYNDMTSYPIWDSAHRLVYIVNVVVTVRRDNSRAEVLAGKLYLEKHCQDPFDITATAKAANLSISGFTKLFKKESGLSPYDYYLDLKLQKLRSRLLDRNITVAQAFLDCGMTYNSHYAALFKKKTGLTPLQFRKVNLLK